MMFRSAAVFTKSLNSKLHHRGPTSFAYIFLCSAICIKSSASYAFTRRSVVATMTTSVATGTNSSSQQFWNRELSAKQAFDRKAPVAKEADIICVADPNDAANSDLYQLTERNDGARVLKVGYPIKELRGSTLGVIGYGDIGQAAARLANAYGMKVHAMRRRSPAPGEQDPIAEVLYGNSKDELQKIFSSCDYILCAMPLTPETKGMIGKAEFDVAKEGAVFINVGRGPIVDEPEMIAALRDGRLKGVGLDVFAMEPLPKDSPLWKLDNVLLSPHSKFFVRDVLSVLF